MDGLREVETVNSRSDVVDDETEHVVLDEETAVRARFQHKQLGKRLRGIVVSLLWITKDSYMLNLVLIIWQ